MKILLYSYHSNSNYFTNILKFDNNSCFPLCGMTVVNSGTDALMKKFPSTEVATDRCLSVKLGISVRCSAFTCYVSKIFFFWNRGP